MTVTTARDTNDHPAVIFQPSDSYTCGAIPLEHRHVSSCSSKHRQWLQQWVGPGGGPNKTFCKYLSVWPADESN